MDKRVGLMALGIVAAIAIVIVVLATGGSPPERADAGGDVVVGDGPDAPEDLTLADIEAAEVRREGDRLLFEAQMGKELPSELPNGSLELRWDILEDGDETWIVLASITIEPTAALTAQRTEYGASTIDGSMPGTIAIDGARLVIELVPGEVPDFPETFGWRLQSTLDANLRDPSSGEARDSAPDGGPGQVQH